MKLSDLTIKSIKEFISGDNQLTPDLSGPNILKLFNQVGLKMYINIKTEECQPIE